MSTPIFANARELRDVEILVDAIYTGLGVSRGSPAFLEAIAMQLGMPGEQTVPAAIEEAGRNIAESIDCLTAAIEKLGATK
jgi:hypothetical protein